MLGRLHIEMAYLSALGDWLDCSGWMADSFHDKFRQHVVSLVSMTETLENLENDETLICLNAKDIAENIVCDTVYKLESAETQKSQE